MKQISLAESESRAGFYPIAAACAKHQAWRGQAAETASRSQLRMRSVPPVGAANENR
jgi:hypothetical protein